jgi:hypothetical protein
VHVERLGLFTRQAIFTAGKQHVSAVFLNEPEIVLRYRRRGRRLSGLDNLGRLRESDCLEHKITYRESSALDRATCARTRFEPGDSAINGVSAGCTTGLDCGSRQLFEIALSFLPSREVVISEEEIHRSRQGFTRFRRSIVEDQRRGERIGSAMAGRLAAEDRHSNDSERHRA